MRDEHPTPEGVLERTRRDRGARTIEQSACLFEREDVDGEGCRSHGVVDRVRDRGRPALEPMVCDLLERRAGIGESARSLAMQRLPTDSRNVVVEPLAVERVREPQATVFGGHESAARDVVARSASPTMRPSTATLSSTPSTAAGSSTRRTSSETRPSRCRMISRTPSGMETP